MSSMALWLTTFIALTCFGSLVTPSPVPASKNLEGHLREFIRELTNITQNQKVPLCNGSMVWSVNLTADVQFCAALESLANVSNCNAIRKTQRILHSLCSLKPAVRGSSVLVRDTKIEVIHFVKDLLKHVKSFYRKYQPQA